MNTIIIPTTQNIELEYPVANIGDRIIAGVADIAVIALYLFIWTKILNTYYENTYSEWIDYTTDIVWILAFLPAALYSLLCEIFFSGQTVGKRLMNTKTIRVDGAVPTISNYMIRWMLRIVDVWMSMGFLLVPGVIGLVTISVNKKGQRLGDLAAGTTVIKLKLVTTFRYTMFMETAQDYEVVYHQIQSLSDRDVAILKEVLDAGVKSSNPALLEKLANKVKEVAGIEDNTPPKKFLLTVLKDYNHLFGKDAEFRS
ncbi:MAG: RDD family protein [Bacteroidetes bacterium]|nr:RDD family protein [Bacteroidota bacterium]